MLPVDLFHWKVADGALKDVVPHSFPLVLGSDGAGLVVKVGPGVTGYREGEDRVYGQFMQLPQGQGSYSEFDARPSGRQSRADPGRARLSGSGRAADRRGHGVPGGRGGRPERRPDASDQRRERWRRAVGDPVAARLGARVVATGAADVAEYLRELGAHTVIDFTEAPTHEQVAAAPETLKELARLAANGELRRAGSSRRCRCMGRRRLLRTHGPVTRGKDRDPALRDITREVG